MHCTKSPFILYDMQNLIVECSPIVTMLDYSGLFTGHAVHGLRVQFGAAGCGSRVDLFEG
ncbi:hypothetical protein HanPSC8_Chr09g0350791 [Helianthus annuus]|nr:hypothetical protein HanPSC8_Chr09g0350791 [Helianthus annuus]